MIKYILFLVFFASILVDARPQTIKELVVKLPTYKCADDLSGISAGRKINADIYNKYFANSASEFIIGLNGEKINDGLVGEREDSISFNSLDDNLNEIKIVKENKLWIAGCLSLNPDFQTAVLVEESFESKIIGLYNFNDKGILLSALRLFEYSLNENGEVQYNVTNGDINKDCIIHQHTEADFMIDRKFILSDEGRFKVIEEKIQDF